MKQSAFLSSLLIAVILCLFVSPGLGYGWDFPLRETICQKLKILDCREGEPEPSFREKQAWFESQAADLKKRFDSAPDAKGKRDAEADITRFRQPPEPVTIKKFQGVVAKTDEKVITLASQNHTYTLRYTDVDRDSLSALLSAVPGDVITWSGGLEKETSWTDEGFFKAPEWEGYITSCTIDRAKK
jgi:hypothetical protein